MKLSVSRTAALFNVSVRTLHYYDEIGLLSPDEVSDSGYRYYDDTAQKRLSEILFFKELGFSLKETDDILSHPDYDRSVALMRHRELLVLKKGHIDSLIKIIDNTIGDDKMKDEFITAEDIKNKENEYAQEVKERWGDTEQYKQSTEKQKSHTKENREEIDREAKEIFSRFAELIGSEVGDEKVQQLVKCWQEHITRYYYDCSNEMLLCLSQMYTGDERFKAYIDSFKEGNAQFVCDAIAYYCKH